MKSFLQSQSWADFQKSLERKIWQINKNLVIKHNLPLNKNYLYSPRICSTIASFNKQAEFGEFLSKVRQIAKNEKAIFFKLEFKNNISKRILKEFDLKKGKNIQPKKTLILNISKSEKELLNQMHKKTRYNIRLAKRKGVVVEKSQNLEEFWKLLEQTSKRDKFSLHSKKYYKKILKVPGIELFLAKLNKKVVAANIVLFYKNCGVYLFGASNYKYRKLMSPFLLQWEQIKEAKKKGCKQYDFWGIDKKRWPGVTRFKKGFKGNEVEYPGAYDLVFRHFWYKVYKIARKIL